MPNFNLKKSDFKTETDSFYDEKSSPPINEEFAKTVAKWKEEKGLNEDNLLNYDRNSTSVILFGNKVEITYTPSEIELDESDFIIGLNQKLNWISKNKNEINSIVSTKLLPLKNESWLNENESKFSEKDFVNRIKLASILFFGDLSFELIYEDGNVFWNHQIVAEFNEKNELTNVNIQG